MLTGTNNALKASVEATVYNTLRNLQLPRLPDGAAFPEEDVRNIAKAVAAGMSTFLDHILANANVAPGIPVATAGSPSAQTGATTAPGKIV